MVSLVLLVLAAAGAVLTTVQVLLVARLRRRRGPFAASPAGRTPFRPGASSRGTRLSILKPLSGLDDELRENLESFARLEGIPCEVSHSAESEHDQAVAVAREVMARFPEAPFRLVVGGPSRSRLVNRKVERLVAAAREARGEILLVSDSNVRVRPTDPAETVALFDDPAVGCVSNLFVGESARTLGAAVESLHLLTFVAPGAALADAAGVPCVVGKSMAVSKGALHAVGGFEAFRDVLAEDQAIGRAMKEAGYEVVVSPVVVRNVVTTRRLGRALARQARWNRIRFSFSKAAYAGEILLNPFGIALLACGTALTTSRQFLLLSAASAGLLSLLRVGQAALLARLLGARLPFRHLPLMPLKDVLQLAVQLVPLFSREIDWHGHRARLGQGTLLLPSRRAAAVPV